MVSERQALVLQLPPDMREHVDNDWPGLSYLRLAVAEGGASKLSPFGMGVVPGVLQSPGMRRRIIAGVPDLTPDQQARRAQFREQRRERRLQKELGAVLTRSALTGLPTEVAAEQLAQLSETRHPWSLQVIDDELAVGILWRLGMPTPPNALRLLGFTVIDGNNWRAASESRIELSAPLADPAMRIVSEQEWYGVGLTDGNDATPDTSDPRGAQRYATAFAMLSEAAMSPADTQDYINDLRVQLPPITT
ncbi:MAG TPA: Scr1 family TA system antitoxin-like transcriptional regulator [Bacillota bacterium]|nr:Scr1 family TA system antitoxin-like transcriptional regulator [Bacillota bacterium]